MENKLRNKHSQTCIANSHTSSLAMHKDSHIVSKTKPKIRIIHIFAPEIIKTDVENFRELVQKLTGKPSGGEKCCKNKKTRRNFSSGSEMSEENRVIMKKKEQRRDRVLKEEIKICNEENSCGGGYLGGFSDLEGFISEIGQFPLLPLDATHHHLQGFEEHQLLF